MADVTELLSTQHDVSKKNEKQIDCIIIKRKHLKFNKDAETNDMILMGSDHRCHHSEEGWP